jgi:hypothetical protein
VPKNESFSSYLKDLKLKKTPPALENLSLSIYIYQIVHEMNGFVESVQMMIIFYETYIAAQQELGKITFDLC